MTETDALFLEADREYNLLVEADELFQRVGQQFEPAFYECDWTKIRQLSRITEKVIRRICRRSDAYIAACGGKNHGISR